MAVHPCGPSTEFSCVCRLLCEGEWPTEVFVRLTWPLGSSGSTGDPAKPLVPLGPTLVLELGADGRATACGRTEPETATVPACVPPTP